MAIDDPLDVAAVHGVCGVWGLLAVGFFADRAMLADIYAKRPPESFGVAMGSNNASLLIAQVMVASPPTRTAGWYGASSAVVRQQVGCPQVLVALAIMAVDPRSCFARSSCSRWLSWAGRPARQPSSLPS